MPIMQFYRSIRSILRNTHIKRSVGVARHMRWQIRKAFNQFPVEQSISASKIVATHRRCAVSALINSQGLYNYNNMRMIQELLRSGGVFFDVGANIGSYTLIASEMSMASVLSFEPHPGTFRLLQENIALNQRDNVRCFNLALGQKEGEIWFSNEHGSAMNHILTESSGNAISVKCVPASTICKEHNLAPQYVKIDVEGFEYDVLKGFGKYLGEVDVLFIEMNGLSDARSRGRGDIEELLRPFGFIGPLYSDFDGRLLSTHRGGGCEDEIYVSPRFRASTRAWTFRI